MTVLTVLIFITMGGWILFEVLLIVRDHRRGKGRADADRGTRILNGVLVVGSVVVAADLSGAVTALKVPGAVWFSLAGIIVVWLGLTLRLWAIASLGAAFRTTVEVDRDQRVVTAGPYRWVRHPSYTGMLIVTLGFGIALGNWLSLAICVVLPPIALLRRITVEEAALARVLGEPYRAYQARTKRLVPGVW